MKPEDIIIGNQYYVIHTDYNGTHILHVTASWKKTPQTILFIGVDDYFDVAHQPAEDAFETYKEAVAELYKRNSNGGE